MTDKEEKLLEKNGWQVVCLSPFEIEHKATGETAQGLGAQLILDAYKMQKKNERRMR